MQRLRSQAFAAFESADYSAAITFLDKILEVSLSAGSPGAGSATQLLELCELEKLRCVYKLPKPG